MEPKVTLYVTQTCPYCKMTSEYLAANGVAYEENYVDDDPVTAQQMAEKVGQMGVPFAVIKVVDGDDVHVFGFDKGKLNAALGLGNLE